MQGTQNLFLNQATVTFLNCYALDVLEKFDTTEICICGLGHRRVSGVEAHASGQCHPGTTNNPSRDGVYVMLRFTLSAAP